MPSHSSLKFICCLVCLNLVAEDAWSGLSLLTRTCPRTGGGAGGEGRGGTTSPTLKTNNYRRYDCAAGIGIHLFPITSTKTYTRLIGRLLLHNYRSTTTYVLPWASSYKLFFLNLGLQSLPWDNEILSS